LLQKNCKKKKESADTARWQADRERCWRAFLRNAERNFQKDPIIGKP
jgi:hypothetical protein